MLLRSLIKVVEVDEYIEKKKILQQQKKKKLTNSGKTF